MPKNVITPLYLMDEEPVAGDNTSVAVDIKWLDNVGIQVDFGGTLTNITGDVTVEVSNDHSVNPDGSVRNAGIWNIVPNMDVQVTAGVPGSMMLDMNQLSAAYVRLRFDNEFVEEGDITTVADVASSLNDTYFFLESSGVTYYVWINVDGAGTDPDVEGATGVEVEIEEDDNADAVALAVEAAIDAAITTIAPTVTGDDINFTQTNPAIHGALYDSTDAPTGFTFAYTDATAGHITAILTAKAL